MNSILDRVLGRAMAAPIQEMRLRTITPSEFQAGWVFNPKSWQKPRKPGKRKAKKPNVGLQMGTITAKQFLSGEAYKNYRKPDRRTKPNPAIKPFRLDGPSV